MTAFSVGTRFGRLVITKVLGYSAPAPSGARRRLYESVCDCGTVSVKRHNTLQSGISNSCGCLQRERTSQACFKHGHRSGNSAKEKTKTYKVWLGMKVRCNSVANVDYPNYGGRGVKVCAAWDSSFEAFIADMGPHPGGELTIDRIDNFGDYEPGNCRWATVIEQANNRRSSRFFELHGAKVTARELADRAGVAIDTMYQRLTRGGMTAEQALGFGGSAV